MVKNACSKKCEQTVAAKVDKRTGVVIASHPCNSCAMKGSNFCAAHTRKALYSVSRCPVIITKKDKNCRIAKPTARQAAAMKARGISAAKPKTCKNRSMPGSAHGYCSLHSQLLEGTMTRKSNQPRKTRKRSCFVAATADRNSTEPVDTTPVMPFSSGSLL